MAAEGKPNDMTQTDWLNEKYHTPRMIHAALDFSFLCKPQITDNTSINSTCAFKGVHLFNWLGFYILRKCTCTLRRLSGLSKRQKEQLKFKMDVIFILSRRFFISKIFVHYIVSFIFDNKCLMDVITFTFFFR